MFSSVVVIPSGGGEGKASADTKKEITESMIPPMHDVSEG
jgi:hypothetical protein